MLKKLILNIALLLPACFGFAQTMPKPDHVVIVVLENTSYSAILNSSSANYIKGLAADTNTALFTNSFGITHPSQPNYIALFSGSTQGVSDDALPSGLPFKAPNLGASLIAKGYTFKGYSEDLPSVGWSGEYSGTYGRKHSPWVNWQGSSSNGVPASSNAPWTDFPVNNYDALPTVSFVMPGSKNNMHDPPYTTTAIKNGDTWVQNNMDSYVQYAKTHNSLLILTFDEDDNNQNNQVVTLMIGGQVKGGKYTQKVNHYGVLRTLEDMYGLPYAGASASASPITNSWKTATSGGGSGTGGGTPKDSTKGTTTATAPINKPGYNGEILSVFPNPAKEKIQFKYVAESPQDVKVFVNDDAGRLVAQQSMSVLEGANILSVGEKQNLANGVYFLTVQSANKKKFTKKVLMMTK